MYKLYLDIGLFENICWVPESGIVSQICELINSARASQVIPFQDISLEAFTFEFFGKPINLSIKLGLVLTHIRFTPIVDILKLTTFEFLDSPRSLESP
jgi:hypothetical protein